MSQAQVAKQLGLSQARISQLLRAAEEQHVVETIVHVPPGMFSDTEEELERAFAIEEVVVVDTGPLSGEPRKALGASAAPFLRDCLDGAHVIGVTAWSETLHAAVEVMRPLPPGPERFVVNVFGGFGPSTSQKYSQLMQQLARLCGARPLFLLGPGVVATPKLRNALRREPQVRDVVSFYDRLSVLLVGIGALSQRGVLRETGYVSKADEAELRAKGAVGDVALHFFDAAGRPVHSSLSERILGIGFDQLKRTPRVVGVAGGEEKVEAIRAALRGRWINSLITDLSTAQCLLRGGP
jgi:DNA-binding transcriptional regulator LsrR (DeoR family)